MLIIMLLEYWSLGSVGHGMQSRGEITIVWSAICVCDFFSHPGGATRATRSGQDEVGPVSRCSSSTKP